MYPFIYVETFQSRPSSITLYALSNGEKYKFISLSDYFANLPLEKLVMATTAIIRRYRRKHRCLCPFFGEIKSFVVFVSERVSLIFDPFGSYIGIKINGSAPLKPIAYCSL